jgi:hypothetical protein
MHLALAYIVGFVHRMGSGDFGCSTVDNPAPGHQTKGRMVDNHKGKYYPDHGPQQSSNLETFAPFVLSEILVEGKATDSVKRVLREMSRVDVDNPNALDVTPYISCCLSTDISKGRFAHQNLII